MRSNEFKGASLAEAVRNATAAYRRRPVYECKRSCAEVEIRVELAKNKLADQADRAEELGRRAENLAREARRKALVAAVEAFIAIAGPLGAFGRAARLIARLSKGKLDLQDVQKLVPAIAAVLAAKDALDAIGELSEARTMARQAESLMRSAENTRDDLFELIREFDNCEPTPMS